MIIRALLDEEKQPSRYKVHGSKKPPRIGEKIFVREYKHDGKVIIDDSFFPVKIMGLKDLIFRLALAWD